MRPAVLQQAAVRGDAATPRKAAEPRAFTGDSDQHAGGALPSSVGRCGGADVSGTLAQPLQAAPPSASSSKFRRSVLPCPARRTPRRRPAARRRSGCCTPPARRPRRWRPPAAARRERRRFCAFHPWTARLRRPRPPKPPPPPSRTRWRPRAWRSSAAASRRRRLLRCAPRCEALAAACASAAHIGPLRCRCAPPVRCVRL